MHVPVEVIRRVVTAALNEDIGSGDLTTETAVPADLGARAAFVARESGVLAGLPVISEVFAQLDSRVQLRSLLNDGDAFAAGTTLAVINGPARGILSGERVALNLLQRLCGVAALTARYVAAVEGTAVRILDTRKTTPGLRVLEKYAVRVGGGTNHRFGLYDGVMLKDNHLAVLAAQGLDIAAAVARVRARVGPMVTIEVEVESAQAAAEAAAAGADLILLDNMAPEQLRAAVAAVAGRARTEASGGINLQTVRAAAESGVDFISVGALTHSARALDIGLDIAFEAAA
jgi:nicotinate-nucleotide pyrophosphorylase (carboxylating)